MAGRFVSASTSSGGGAAAGQGVGQGPRECLDQAAEPGGQSELEVHATETAGE